MRFERLRTAGTAAVLSFVITLGSVGCLITGFDFSPADFPRLAGIWAAAALVIGLVAVRRHGTAILWSAAGLALGYLWHAGELTEALKAMIYRIGSVYGQAYGFTFLLFRAEGDRVLTMDSPLAVYGVILILLVCLAICRRSTVIFAAAGALLPLGLCMVVTDTVPEIWALFCLLCGLGLLLLTGSVRRESPGQGNRLTAIAAVPVILSVGLLFLLIPQKGYVNRSEAVRTYLRTKMETLPALVEGNGSISIFAQASTADSRVDLASLRGQNNQEIPVMRVTAEKSQTLYLRGQDYDVYTGTGWESTGSRQEDFSGWGEPVETVKITTFHPQSLVYLPYYPESGSILRDGMIVNEDGRMVFSANRYAMGSAVSEQLLARNLVLPSATETAAVKLLPEGCGGAPSEAATVIGNLVRGTAPYNRQTERMPEDETDFAMWFLRDAEVGCCVHFATASVVLLRAAGIPARYVTGYKAEAAAGEEIVVTTRDAHAWAEYYDGEMGMWRILESTPGSPEEEPTATAPMQTEPAQVTLPEATETQLPTETTAPTQPGQPEQEAPALRRKWLAAGLFALMASAGVCLLAIARRLIWLGVRRYQMKRRSPNGQALLYWQDAQRLARRMGEEPPEELAELAEKAVFSQYVLEAEELAVFGEYRRRCRRTLQKKPWYCQLVYRYIDVIY